MDFPFIENSSVFDHPWGVPTRVLFRRQPTSLTPRGNNLQPSKRNPVTYLVYPRGKNPLLLQGGRGGAIPPGWGLGNFSPQ